MYQTRCEIGGKKPPCQNQLDSSSQFDTIPACDGRTDGYDDSIYRASMAPRGKKDMTIVTSETYVLIVLEVLIAFVQSI